MKVLVVLGHPNGESLCAGLADAFTDGAMQVGQEVRTLRLGEIAFDINYPIGREHAPEEPDLAAAREAVSWADHLVFVFPNWWGTMPALMKGFVDRIFKPGYAFNMHEDGTWDQLLRGKTAQLIVTMDTPGWVYRHIYRQPGINALKRATLGFCGIHPVRTLTFGTVFDSTPARRRRWLDRAREAGAALAEGVPNPREALRAKAASWIRAMRLQFYPMTWFAYTVGAMAAGGGQAIFRQPLYWLGYAALFLLEFATVLLNEYFDYDSDRRNRNFSPFNGGSRVLVDGSLSFREVRYGILVVTGGFVLCSYSLFGVTDAPGVTLSTLLLAAAVLCLGYTAPPFKFSHRGLGEFDVALTHSFLVTLLGYLLMGGGIFDEFPWLASVPLFLSILPAILLSGLPDLEADTAAGKRTLAVSQGGRRVIELAMAATAASAATAVVWHLANVAGGVYAGAAYFIPVHAAWLLSRLQRYRDTTPKGRINKLMVLSLTYILWFVVIPFANSV
jgi:putative NADPH-quinone reductase/4-hydroxybenzoate polyprenyltransferase